MSKRKLWIRVDADTPRDPRIVSLALSLGTSPGQMLGHCVCVWLAVAEHCADGDMSLVTSGTIEHWAQWTGVEGFGQAFLSAFVQDGVLQAFRDRNAKLAQQRDKEREKKRRQRAGHAGDKRGTSELSLSTERNGTEQKKEQAHKAAVAAVRDEPSGFAECWAQYPKRHGDNPRRQAARGYAARLQAGVTPDELLAGVQRYRAWCEAEGRVGTEFVMQARRFFGPDEPFRQPWAPREDEASWDDVPVAQDDGVAA